MVDLLIIYDVDGWAYHWQAQALARHAPDDFRVRLAAIDILPGTPHDHAATPDEANHWEHHFARRIQPAEYSAALDAVLGTKPPDLIFVMCHHQLPGVREDSPVNGASATVVRSVSCMWAQAGR